MVFWWTTRHYQPHPLSVTSRWWRWSRSLVSKYCGPDNFLWLLDQGRCRVAGSNPTWGRPPVQISLWSIRQDTIVQTDRPRGRVSGQNGGSTRLCHPSPLPSSQARYFDSMLGQRLRRWPNIKPTLNQRIAFVGFIEINQRHKMFNKKGTLVQHQTNAGTQNIYVTCLDTWWIKVLTEQIQNQVWYYYKIVFTSIY